MDATVVIAWFTGVLVITTIVYTVVTWRVLRQSKNAFLADLLYRLIEQQLRAMEQTRRESVQAMKDGTSKKVSDWVKLSSILSISWLKGFEKGVTGIDKGLAERLGDIFDRCLKTQGEYFEKEAEGLMTEVKKRERNGNKRGGS